MQAGFVKQAGSRPYQRVQQNANNLEHIARGKSHPISSVTAPNGVRALQKEPHGPPRSIDLRAQGASRLTGPLRIIRAPQGLINGMRVGQRHAGNVLRLAGKDPLGRGRPSERSGIGRPRQDLGSRTFKRQTPRRRRFEDGIETGAREETLGERIYAKSKKDTEAKEAVRAGIAKVHLQTLVGGGPSTATGDWGLSEVVEERLDRLSADGITDSAMRLQQLARKIRQGQLVRFKDEQERNRILADARELVADKQESFETPILVFEQVSNEDRQQFLAELLKGSYIMPKTKGKETVVDLLSRYTTRNGSYLLNQGDSLAAKVKKLLAVQAGGATRYLPAR